MRITIISYNWPPRNAIGTHRPYAWAKSWSAEGVQVSVLTAEKQSFDEPLDMPLPAINGVTVYEVPSKRKAGIVSYLVRNPVIFNVAKKLKNFFERRLGLISDPRRSWHSASSDFINDIAMNSDVVVSTFGPAASHLIANDIKVRNPEVVWVADYRDLWGGSHLNSLSVEDQKIEQETVGDRADFITAVSMDMVDILSKRFSKDAYYFPNGFDLEEGDFGALAAKNNNPPSLPLRIVHTGMLYSDHRDPTPLLDSLVSLEEAGFINKGDAVIEFYGARVDLAKKLHSLPKYEPYIRIMGHVSRSEAVQAQRQADILLLLESPKPEAKGVLTGKLFEYMVAGKPILCIGSRPEFEIGKVIQETGVGVVFGPDQYSSLDDCLVDSFAGGGVYDFYQPSKDHIMRYSRSVQASMFLSLIKDKAGF